VLGTLGMPQSRMNQRLAQAHKDELPFSFLITRPVPPFLLKREPNRETRLGGNGIGAQERAVPLQQYANRTGEDRQCGPSRR
jgi:hypothetical protein